MTRVSFTEKALRQRATAALGAGGTLATPTGLVFDEAAVLPPMPELSGFPLFEALRKIVPSPYMLLIDEAYVQMSNFAANWWPSIHGVVYAEPFFEWLMHVDPFNLSYRDHIVHQVRVAAIGDRLLEERVNGNRLLDCVVGSLPRALQETGDPRNTARAAWWMTGLFHDCGYPYEAHTKHHGKLKGSYVVPVGPPTDVYWSPERKHLARLAGRLTSEDQKLWDHGRHSLTGAAEIAAENLVYQSGVGRSERRRYGTRRRAFLRLALQAILTHHHLRAPGARIRFDDQPLTYLLVLSDELHEGARTLATARAAGGRKRLTEVTYGTGDVVSAGAEWGPGASPRLEIVFRCRKGTTRINGKANAEWADAKKSALTKLLKFGHGELFNAVSVAVVPRPA